jgi:hypothetical protein
LADGLEHEGAISNGSQPPPHGHEGEQSNPYSDQQFSGVLAVLARRDNTKKALHTEALPELRTCKSKANKRPQHL